MVYVMCLLLKLAKANVFKGVTEVGVEYLVNALEEMAHKVN